MFNWVDQMRFSNSHVHEYKQLVALKMIMINLFCIFFLPHFLVLSFQTKFVSFYQNIPIETKILKLNIDKTRAFPKDICY